MKPARSRTPTSAGPKEIRSSYLLKFLAFGEGDTAPVTREVLRQIGSLILFGVLGFT